MSNITIWDWFTPGKTARIFQMVMTLTSWTTGLDKRLNRIERRLGAIEMALTGHGIDIPKIDVDKESEE